MGIRKEIQAQIQEAIKQKQKTKLLSLRFFWDSILKKEKEKRLKLIKSGASEEESTEKNQLSDEEIQSIASSLIKKDKEALVQFKNAGREDLAQREKEDIEILGNFLPEQLKEQDLLKIIKQTIQESQAENIKDMGKVMKLLMPKIQGRADGGEISRITKELLS